MVEETFKEQLFDKLCQEQHIVSRTGDQIRKQWVLFTVVKMAIFSHF